LRRRLVRAAWGLWAPWACGDGGGGRESADTGSGITVTATEGDATATLSDSSASADTGSGTADAGCPADALCGETACCAAGEVCVDGECVADCGDSDPCGAEQVCCGDGQICFIGSCIVPGEPCKGLQCASSVESECADGELCDPELGLCVPNFANPECAFQPEVGEFDPVPRFTWGVRKTRACDLGCQTEENCVNDVCTPTWTHVDIAADDFPGWH